MRISPDRGSPTLDIGLEVFSNYPIHGGVARISVVTGCREEGSDEASEHPVSASAVLVVTLTQGTHTKTKTRVFTCFGEQTQSFRFRHFHVGEATLQVIFAACNADGCEAGSNDVTVLLEAA